MNRAYSYDMIVDRPPRYDPILPKFKENLRDLPSPHDGPRGPQLPETAPEDRLMHATFGFRGNKGMDQHNNPNAIPYDLPDLTSLDICSYRQGPSIVAFDGLGRQQDAVDIPGDPTYFLQENVPNRPDGTRGMRRTGVMTSGGTIYSKPSLRAPYVDDGPKDVGFFYDANGTRRLIPVSRDPDDYDSSMRERLQQRPAAISD